jgi:uncharacterized protein (DUF927 family)
MKKRARGGEEEEEEEEEEEGTIAIKQHPRRFAECGRARLETRPER